MAQQVKKSDIRITRFRLPDEDLRTQGSGCLIYHIPTKQSFVKETEQPFPSNKKDAMSQLCSALGTTVEALEQQEDRTVFPEWTTTELYTRDYGLFIITVFFLKGEEDPELEGWTWGLESSRNWVHDPGIYETSEGAIRAAEKWASEMLEEENSDDKKDESKAKKPNG